ncbi:MAG: hypothetical protein AB7V27_14880 [Candidatus Binatia bacterium]
MNRSLICVHCGSFVVLETGSDRFGTRLLTHLVGLHGGLVSFDALPRWAELFEHFRVVPQHYPSVPRVLHA